MSETKRFVDDCVRDLMLSHQYELVVPVTDQVLARIGESRSEPWFARHQDRLCGAGKLTRFVKNKGGVK